LLENLFGSKARGDADLDSDYDILRVVADDRLPRLRRSRPAYRIFGERESPPTS
jgi:predicted nucleotidyltransferase